MCSVDGTKLIKFCSINKTIMHLRDILATNREEFFNILINHVVLYCVKRTHIKISLPTLKEGRPIIEKI